MKMTKPGRGGKGITDSERNRGEGKSGKFPHEAKQGLKDEEKENSYWTDEQGGLREKFQGDADFGDDNTVAEVPELKEPMHRLKAKGVIKPTAHYQQDLTGTPEQVHLLFNER